MVPKRKRKRKRKTTYHQSCLKQSTLCSPSLPRFRIIIIKQRVEAVAKAGSKVYQIGSPDKFDIDELQSLAEEHDLRCVSLAGTGEIGLSTGLTAPGKEKIYLDYFTKMVNIAKKLRAVNFVFSSVKNKKIFPGEQQYKQIISGLKKAGDIAGEAGVYFTLEP